MTLIHKTNHHEIWQASHGKFEVYSLTHLVDVCDCIDDARALVARLES